MAALDSDDRGCELDVDVDLTAGISFLYFLSVGLALSCDLHLDDA